MNHSRKKISPDSLNLFSVSEKLRQKPSKSLFRRPCCDKENCHSFESKLSKLRDPSKSSKKARKKRFLEEEVEKLLQNRTSNESKMNQIKLTNANELVELRGDLEQMKGALYKLSSEGWLPEKEKEAPSTQEQLKQVCIELQATVQALKQQLSSQQQTYSQLEVSYSQLQATFVQAKQLNQCQSIEVQKELKEKEVAINEQIKQIREKQRLIGELQLRLKKQVQSASQQANKAQQQILTLFNENRQLVEAQNILKNEVQASKKVITNLEAQIEKEKEGATEEQKRLEEETDRLAKEKEQLECHLNTVQSDYNTTKVSLGNTENKLRGLISMEKKCEDLYHEIKSQKSRWDNINFEANQEKEMIESELSSVTNQKQQLSCQLKEIQDQLKEHEEQIQSLKSKQEQANEDRDELLKQINTQQLEIAKLTRQKSEMERQKQSLATKCEEFRVSLEEKQHSWESSKKKLDSRIKLLSSEKTSLEVEVKGTLEAAKKRNDEAQLQVLVHRNKVRELEKQSKQTRAQFNQQTEALREQFKLQTGVLRAQVKIKEQKIADMEVRIGHTQTTLKTVLEKNQELEEREKASSFGWQQKHELINKKLEACLSELRDSKSLNDYLQTEVTKKEDSINDLSWANKEHKLKCSDLESLFNNSETNRLSLSQELTQFRRASRKAEEQFRQEKNHFERELLRKNAVVEGLKEKMRLVKDQSEKIQEQLREFEKMNQLEELFESQLSIIKNSITNLTREKDELKLKMYNLQTQNEELSRRVVQMEGNLSQQEQEKQDILKNVTELESNNNHYQATIDQHKKRILELEAMTNSLSQTKEEELNSLKNQIDEEKKAHFDKAKQCEVSVGQSNKHVEMLMSDVQAKEKTISELNGRLKAFEEKKRKVVNEVHGIQNQIAELALRNSSLEEQNELLMEELRVKQEAKRHLQQRNALLDEGRKVLEEKSSTLEEQSQALRGQISRVKEQLSMTEQKSHRSINEVYQICEARKSQAVDQLKDKVNQLANELSSCIHKLTLRQSQVQTLEAKYAKIQNVLEENHHLLTDERAKCDKLTLQLQSVTSQMGSKDKEMDTISRDKTILREKLSESEYRWESLKRKFEYLQQQKGQLERQMENQGVTLRILREENNNIEKVMAEQINQRKVIIEQLVTQKRMLYSQLHQER